MAKINGRFAEIDVNKRSSEARKEARELNVMLVNFRPHIVAYLYNNKISSFDETTEFSSP